MPSHPRKKQKLSKDQPMHHDSDKDDEELELESMLFGKKMPSKKRAAEAPIESVGKAMDNLMDSDLFFVDEGAGEAASSSTSSNSEDETHRQASRKKPTAAWEDPSDPTSVPVTSGRARKLRDAPTEETLTGREYESRLRRQFERINPEPAWARKGRKAKRTTGEDDSAEDTDDEVQNILTSTSGVTGKPSKPKALAAGALSIERLRDVNANGSPSAGEVKTMSFHPSPQVPVLAVGSKDRRIRLYNIDGHTSPLLQTLHIPSLPLTESKFHPTGSHLLLTGPRPYYYVYDLQSSVVTQSKVWGTGDKASLPSMETTAFSSTGDVLAVAGRNGIVQLLDFKNGGQQLASLKCTSGGGIQDMWFGDNQQLTVLTTDAEVYAWDIGQRKCVKRWQDFGGYRGSAKVMAGSSRWLSIGSNTGLVNIYGADTLTQQESASKLNPAKTLGHITTSISTLRFNHDAQLMAVASREKKGAMRLIHFPSFTSFSNWPTSGTPLGHVTAVDFSASSEFMAIGNARGKVLLYSLRSYGVNA